MASYSARACVPLKLFCRLEVGPCSSKRSAEKSVALAQNHLCGGYFSPRGEERHERLGDAKNACRLDGVEGTPQREAICKSGDPGMDKRHAILLENFQKCNRRFFVISVFGCRLSVVDFRWSAVDKKCRATRTSTSSTWYLVLLRVLL